MLDEREAREFFGPAAIGFILGLLVSIGPYVIFSQHVGDLHGRLDKIDKHIVDTKTILIDIATAKK